MKIFTHTSRESGMWRGWLASGQTLEMYWGKPCGVGLRVLVHSDDSDNGDRMLCIAVGFAQIFIPTGIMEGPISIDSEPSWGAEVSREFGAVVCWGRRRWSADLPLTKKSIAYEYEGEDGEWHEVLRSSAPAKLETHPYTYHLRSGETQHRYATIGRRRHVLGRKGLPSRVWKWASECIDIEFDDEVGERSGSWKGGCIGCAYDTLPGEAPLDALRRMEAERSF